MYIITNRDHHRDTEGRWYGDDGIDPHGLSYVRPDESESHAYDYGRTDFHGLIIKHLRELAKSDARPLIVCPIHGFNEGWPEAVEFVGRVDREITANLPAAMTVGFSWPSIGKTSQYVSDRVRVRRSAATMSEVLARALELLRREGCPAEIVVIAHSMGNYALSKAVSYLAESTGVSDFQMFAEVLMVAPDLDDNALEAGRVAADVTRFARRVTVYRSRKDGALVASQAKRAGTTGGRLGRQGPRHLDRIPGNVAVVVADSRMDNVKAIPAHSHYFHDEACLADMRMTAAGMDRHLIETRVGHLHRLAGTPSEFWLK